MLFSKEIEKRCEVCQHSKKINDDEAICRKHGIVSLGYKCRHFAYDATKRIPSETDFFESNFTESDFSLDK
ncbi:MAG: hypothetical protein IKU65_01085 [Oscillospiraceae bacterium]|nr:hypothetical protein [Oscillospiraceae bacterium]